MSAHTPELPEHRDGWGGDLSAEAISIAREQFKEACGVETAFFDDASKMMAILASRAILAGLHSDIKDDDTRARMEAAAEKLRAVHERNLGHGITSQERDGA